MLIVHVHVHVKPECVEAFKAATLENARQSIREPGTARFDPERASFGLFRHTVPVWRLKTGY